ncbi:FAD/NAD(P)-binding domain-containing protein [Piedraia hortae CBS 480.64]|uniref:FAD/NAD(P)-binding domain-containing protein n=1 Tax=Piedraia hortae CBS 480.64 TaxID=1314780 RepID=A0A6A7BRD8_9PEZI|nr:FAD/NAD(P)-binding domain-containing protein [Piedraia hortae CBS 480.64]
MTLEISIIGSGMGGLALALSLSCQNFQNITVYESASNLGFVGAGIQLAPNLARILNTLGVWEDVEREAVDLRSTSIRLGRTDGELGFVELGDVRRVGCERKGVGFCFGERVTNVVSYGPRPRFRVEGREGVREVQCNVLIAADGVKSLVRDGMMRRAGKEVKVEETGQAAYRIMLRREDMEHDPELLELVDGESVTRWIGEKRHIIAYPVARHRIYNLSTVQPDRNFAAAPSEMYTTKGSKRQMMEVFADFCPKVRRMLDLVPNGEVCEWKLRVHEPLPFWTWDQTALLGDACHPTLPHLAQGAAQAVEDAAVLARVLAKLPNESPEAIAKGLRVYEAMRRDRAYALVELAAASGRALHLGEGAAKEERDRQFAALKQGKGPVPDKWADEDVQKMIYTDVVCKVDEEFESLYRNLSDSQS